MKKHNVSKLTKTKDKDLVAQMKGAADIYQSPRLKYLGSLSQLIKGPQSGPAIDEQSQFNIL